MDDPYMNLANAVVLQAVSDYRRALKQLKRNSKYEPALSMKKECERFFHSTWFEFLTSLDPDYLLEGIERIQV